MKGCLKCGKETMMSWNGFCEDCIKPNTELLNASFLMFALHQYKEATGNDVFQWAQDTYLKEG